MIIKAIRFYQKAISPYMPVACKFQPTCSEYMILSIKQKGLFLGIVNGFLRILRCHPLSRGGFDPVK